MNGTRGEVLIGVLVLALGALLLGWAYSGSGKRAEVGYPIQARFNQVSGLRSGSEVRLAGMVVGGVERIQLDPAFGAVVTLRIRNDVALTADTAAAIFTDGLLGPKFVELQAGGADTMLPPGGKIQFTQDAVVLQDLLATILAEAKAKANQADKAE